ncbi:MAG: hypothetical protein AAFX04_03670 [Pseudomonadota bacterium]
MLIRIAATLLGCLLLAGCFLIPGEFEAYLAIDPDGRYRFAYKGQMQLVLPDDRELRPPKPRQFNPENEVCRRRINRKTGEIDNPEADNGGVELARDSIAVEVATERGEYDENGVYQPLYRYENRECTETELAKRKERVDLENQARQARYEERVAMLNALFGGTIPGDDASMEKLAEKLQGYAGWNSVAYQGNDIFMVDYSAEGQISGGFSFPQLPDAAISMPFVQILPKDEGRYEIIAPALGGKGSVAAFSALDKGMSRRMGEKAILKPSGSFTLTTSGELLANNSQNGYRSEYGRKIVEWTVIKGMESPRALIGPAQ